MNPPPALPPGVRLSAATDADIDAICTALRAFNREAMGGITTEPVALQLHDAQGRRIAGLAGTVYLGWLAIDALWVAADHRGQGLGSQLLREAERRALAAGAHSAFLDTFAWQAADFYRAHGYVEFGRLEDFPAGRPRRFLRRTLAPQPA
ncbi:GNAT family N-acetyltransferase [Xanthomonas sp. XNM01]|uniref:GNAT family N-acetyltransferase n=1 Tax=Xanthomonas sp. XNM01 TaxID=2769289 RepID=UPI00177FDEB6|nr:GNAT family N-acetyltransferase [Xanthomonas sp. XNM01]MBD9367757.1 GNAT family N-acetyltransferase [Xanthomonas sp. XNM01]